MSRIGMLVVALLVLGSLVGAAVVARAPEVNAAWQRVNEQCGQPLAAANCLDLARTLNALRVRVLLAAFCLIFGGAVSALGCSLISTASATTPAAGGRQDLRRGNQTIPLALIAVGGVAVIGGLVLSTWIR